MNTPARPAAHHEDSQPLLAPGDLRKLALIAAGAALALAPSRFWVPVARRLAARTAGRGVKGHIPAPMISLIEAQGFPVAAVLQANHVVEAAQVMRHYLPWRWRPRITLVGREHLDAALAAGHGAVLWVGDFASSNLVAKMALARSGYRVAHVSRTGHPHSDSRLGRSLLNRPQVAVEGRYLSEGRLLLDDGSGALRRAYGLLAQNQVVTIRAGTAATRTAQVPFLGVCLTIALGPPHMAATAGAPLLPLFSVQVTPDEYEVHIGAPLPTAEGRDFTPPATAFAAVLESFVRAHPEQWQGWDAVTSLAGG